MENFWKNLFTVFPVNHRRRVYKQILLQRSLSTKGERLPAEVLKLTKEGHGIYNYIKIKIGVIVKIEGKTKYRQLKTLIKKDSLPGIGERIQICYNPENEFRSFAIMN